MLIPTITSTNNALVKDTVKIRENPVFRHEHQLVLVSGEKMVRELAKISNATVIFIDDPKQAHPFAPTIYVVSHHVLKKITGLPNPEGLAALFKLPSPTALDTKKRILIAESIADPGNLGTMMRTALALGFDGFFQLGTGVDAFHEKVIRASRGALFSLSYELGNWQRLRELTKNKHAQCFVADSHGEPVHNVASQNEIFLLMSNESHGVSHEASNFGKKISVPMSGSMESLNVSIAAAILMFNLIN